LRALCAGLILNTLKAKKGFHAQAAARSTQYEAEFPSYCRHPSGICPGASNKFIFASSKAISYAAMAQPGTAAALS